VQAIERYPLADLRLAVKQKRLKAPTEAAALDVLHGVLHPGHAARCFRRSPPRHDVAVATVVLRALGMDDATAAEVARRPLPSCRARA
jgi:hypothetical protein